MLSIAEPTPAESPAHRHAEGRVLQRCELKGIRSNRSRPTVLSVFSGLGGLDLGLEAAGFRVVGCIEKDVLARESLRRNRPDWKVVEPSNVVEYARVAKPADFGLRRRELDLLAGGPPCQPFSKAAQWHKTARAGLKDPRADCVRSFLDLVSVFLPKAILMENVQGFAQGSTSALPFLRTALNQINSREGVLYEPSSRVLDACDFGVPQHRRRSIIICLRDGGVFEWPNATHRERPICAWDAIGDLHPKNPPVALGRWADLLPSIPEGGNYHYHTPDAAGEPLFGYRTRYWSFLLKLAKNKPSWTLPAQPSQNSGPFHWDNRRLTWKEMARLQSFPKGWQVVGTYADRVRQIGNATPPLLAETIGRELGHQVFGKRYAARRQLSIGRRRNTPPPTPISPVPRRFLSLGLDTRPHPGPGLGPGSVALEAVGKRSGMRR